jgi:allantoinase
MSENFTDAYQWHLRPKIPARPEWFRAWPDQAKLAMHVMVLHEWESTPWHRSRPMPSASHHKFDFLALGAREYGARHGIWRLLDVLRKQNTKATLVASGLVGELFPDTIRAAAGDGHEICTHQWDQSVFPPMFKSKEEERASLVRSIATLEQLSGQKIRGYVSPGPRATPHTLELLAELDFLWIGDFVDSDFPYTINIGGKRLTSISYATPGYVDAELAPRGAVQALTEMKYAFDAAYEEAARHPMIFCYSVHTHWGGTLPMARMLDEFLTYAHNKSGVWFPRCIDIAQFWNAASRG